jgi:hypothetical protein
VNDHQRALAAAADAVSASADIWAGFSMSDAEVCIKAYEAARRTVSGQEAVAKVVPPDVYPGYGWHAEALIDWEKIGAGTLLYAYPIPATFEQKCTVSTPNTAKKSAKGLATLLFGGDDSEETTAPIPATELKDAEQ